jgi:hypothetical protein
MTPSHEQRIVDAMLRHSEALERSDDNAAAEALVDALTEAKLLRGQRRDLRELGLGHSSAERELHQLKVKVNEALFELDGISVPARPRALIEQLFQHALAHAERAVRMAREEGR